MPARSISLLFTRHCAAGLLLCLSACGKDGRHVNVVSRDAGALDAQAGDARAADGAMDAQSGDGAVARGDGGSVGGRDAGDASQDDDAGPSAPFDPSKDCDVIAEQGELSIPVTFGDESGYALTPGLTGFGVAYQSNRCGAIGVLPVAAIGEYQKPSILYSDCSTVAQGVSLLHLEEGYRLTWVDNASGSAELQTLKLPDELKPPADDTRISLTNNQLRELMPVQADIATKHFISWISEDTSAKTRAIMLRTDAAEDTRTLVAADADFNPTKIALAQLGMDSGALMFVSEQKKPGIWMLPLMGDGNARQEPVQLSSWVSAGNNVDVATREEDGGAVIYSLDIGDREEVRFRRLSPTGAFMSGEVKVVTFPLQGRDASITRLGGGYVVAFRSMSDIGATRGEVRLTFVSKEGNLQRDSAGRITTYSLGPASATGGRVTARISRDGQLLVGFLDIDPSNGQGPQFRLIRKRLDCAL